MPKLKRRNSERITCWACGNELKEYEIRSSEGLDADHEDEWYCDDCSPFDDDEFDMFEAEYG